MTDLLLACLVVSLSSLVWVAWKIVGELKSYTKISKAMLTLMADQQGVRLLPDPTEIANASAGQFLHWENYGIRPTAPDDREVESEHR